VQLCLPCHLVRSSSVQPGQLQIFRDCIRFVPEAIHAGSAATGVHAAGAGWAREGEPSLYEPARVRTWRLSGLREILHRRYLLRRVALELFLTCGKAHLLTFESRAHRRRAHAALLSLRPPALLPSSMAVGWPGRDWLEAQHAQLIDDWQRWRISNLDYLLRLNTLAGRTYNDLTQYPVLPWVLKDYSSAELDLDDPCVYRDLSKPVGALEPKRAASFKERFDSLRDEFDPAEAAAGCGGPGSVPPFHYGSHYSSAGIVLYFLLRLEPFTTEAIRLQGGRWRLSPRAWMRPPLWFYAFKQASPGHLPAPARRNCTPHFPRRLPLQRHKPLSAAVPARVSLIRFSPSNNDSSESTPLGEIPLV
jgi:hypothetical protein